MQSTTPWCLNEGSMLKSLKVGHPPVPFSCGPFYGAGGIAVNDEIVRAWLYVTSEYRVGGNLRIYHAMRLLRE